MLPTADKVIARAKKGVKRGSYGSPNKFSRWFGFGNQVVAWCAIYVYYILCATGGKSLMAGCSNKAYCPSVWNWAKNKGYTRTSPKKGDLVLYDWEKDGVCDHIGFVIKDLGNGYIQTIEGNTSNTSNGNGGCIQIRTRSKSLVKGYVRLPYAKVKKVKKSYIGAMPKKVVGLKYGTKSDIKKWQKCLCWIGTNVDIDGIFGLDSETKTRIAQRTLGVNIDGIAGKATFKAFKQYKK